MRRDLFVYIAGPLTGKDGTLVEANVAAALRVFLDCIRRGIPAFCPHLTGGFPSAHAIPWDRWMEYDLAVLDRCTHVLLLPRWAESTGATVERHHAAAVGKPIITSLDEIDLAPAPASAGVFVD